MLAERVKSRTCWGLLMIFPGKIKETEHSTKEQLSVTLRVL